MSTWKIIRKIENDEAKYYCYRKYWFFFWILKRILTQQNYDRLCENVKFDGHDVRKLFNHVNF